MNRLYKMNLCYFMVLFVVSSTAFAQDYQDVCSSDAQNYCPHTDRGNGDMMMCLYKQQNKLSTACRDKIVKMHDYVHARREECRPDAEKFCVGIEHGGGRINACLKEHLSELSETCRKNVLSTVRKGEKLESQQ